MIATSAMPDPPIADADATPALRLRGLEKRFGAVEAVAGVELTLQHGEFLTLLGPSGSGKTTVLKMIAGFERPSAGSIELAGRDVSTLSPAERGIGVVFQQYALFPHMSVEENIAYPLKLRHWSSADRGRRVEEMLTLVELDGYGMRYPRQLSGGQQQRVAVARALAFRPALLLMDEPLGALDRALRIGMQEEIRRIHREAGATVLYVTHDQEEALTMSDRVAILRDGRLLQVGPPRDLYRRPADRFVATFFGECTLVPATLLAPVDADHVRVAALGLEAIVRRGGPALDEDLSLAIRPGKLRLRPAPGDLLLPATVLDVLYLGDSVRIVGRQPAGEVIVRADPDDAAGVAIGQELTLGFAADDAVAVGD
ncbi:MAG TPA: ABC transporter ATP-binding protein [Thermomicrobiales bacterium]|nr:ABC transporter ATP-binding protein [Thermomicrobiales bacterium]